MRLLLIVVVCLLTLAAGMGAAAQTARSQSFYVDATAHGWQSTGVVVKKNRSVVVTAAGSACVIGTACFDPNGRGDNLPGYSPFDNAPWVGGPAYALVGKVGDQLVFIGDGPTLVSGQGELLLAFNDDKVTDNSGGYNVTIAVCRPGHGHGDQNHCRSGPPGRS